MALAQLTNLSSPAKCLLMVEGPDDWHAIHHIYGHIAGTETPFEIGYCGDDVAILDKLGSITVGSGTSKSALGAILDADTDTGVANRLQSIRQRLGAAYDVPETFPADGLVLRPKANRPDKLRLPVIGIWLMPDNVRNGIFEDVLCKAMGVKSFEYIGQVIDKAKEDGMAGFRNVERPKAIVRTHLAWQDPNKKNVGEAIRSHFPELAAACAPFLAWLERLFTAAAAR